MKAYQWTTCERVDYPGNPDYHGEIVVIQGLITPPTFANSRDEALDKLHDWFVEHKVRPYQEVT